MKKQIILFTIAGIAFGTAAFIGFEDKAKVKPIDLNNFDKSVRPQDNFYQYVNGSWLKNNPIPESESRWGSFNELNDKNQAKLHQILEDAAKNTAANADLETKMVGDYYASAMDSVKLNKDGIGPLRTELKNLNIIMNTDDVIKSIAHFHTIGIGPLFSCGVSQDPKISTEYITQFYQGGIGLPDRDYYTKTDERTLGIQKAYKEHIAKMLQFAGDDASKVASEAETIVGADRHRRVGRRRLGFGGAQQPIVIQRQRKE